MFLSIKVSSREWLTLYFLDQDLNFVLKDKMSLSHYVFKESEFQHQIKTQSY